MNKFSIVALLTAAISFPALGQDGSAPGPVISPEVFGAILSTPQGIRNSTYEDLLALLSRPVRFYDFNGDGLTRDELNAVSSLRMQSLRVGMVSQILRFDINNDRSVDRAELAMASRINAATGSGGGMQQQNFDRADANHDGTVTLDEMLTLLPDQQRMTDRDIARIMSATLAIDPTPDTNFTLADARTIVDAVFATYDLDKNGLLDPTEQRAARPNG